MSLPRHEIPTHLNVEDRAFYGLSVRQVMCLTAGFTLGYTLWNQWRDVALELRLALAVTCAVVAIVLAVVRPLGRGFEAWALVLVRYLLLPRRVLWSPRPDDSAFDRRDCGWVELEPHPRWRKEGRCDR